jgi:uncharacterized protein YbcI
VWSMPTLPCERRQTRESQQRGPDVQPKAGRGPTSSRTTIGPDLIVCVMGAALTRGEQTLVSDGKLELVLSTRRAYQDSMRADAISAVETIAGRRVLAFMSNNNIDPDLAVELFVLEPLPRVGLDAPGDAPGDALVRELRPSS